MVKESRPFTAEEIGWAILMKGKPFMIDKPRTPRFGFRWGQLKIFRLVGDQSHRFVIEGPDAEFFIGYPNLYSVLVPNYWTIEQSDQMFRDNFERLLAPLVERNR